MLALSEAMKPLREDKWQSSLLWHDQIVGFELGLRTSQKIGASVAPWLMGQKGNLQEGSISRWPQKAGFEPKMAFRLEF